MSKIAKPVKNTANSLLFSLFSGNSMAKNEGRGGAARKTWMAGTSPAMTPGERFNMTGNAPYAAANLQAGGNNVFSFSTVSTIRCLPPLISKMNSRTNAW